MTRTFTLAEFATYIGALNVDHAKNQALKIACQLVAGEARRVIGTYDLGWPQLKESTQADRERKGYPPNEPLLRSGELRDSIEYTIKEPGRLAEVGSNSDIAVYQELGTSTIPARSFLAGAAHAMGPAVAHVVRDVVGAAIAGRSELRELGHLLRELGHLGHNIKEDFEKLVEEGEHDEHK
jgi:HK97 gp10 family phage protein